MELFFIPIHLLPAIMEEEGTAEKERSKPSE